MRWVFYIMICKVLYTYVIPSLELLAPPHSSRFVFMATLMLFVSNCNGLDKGCGTWARNSRPLRCRTDWMDGIPRFFCSFNDVWAWNFARGVCEVVTGTLDAGLGTLDSKLETPGLAYQFIISFNKVDISPEPLMMLFVRLPRATGSCIMIMGCRVPGVWCLVRDVAMIVCCVLGSLQVSGVAACRAWHFGTFAARPHHHHHLHSAEHMGIGISCGMCGKATPPNDFQMPSALHTRVCKFRKYPLSASFVWDLFVPSASALSACANLENLKIKYNVKIGRPPSAQLGIRKLCSAQCFDHISTQFARYIHTFPPHVTWVRFICFPRKKGKGCDSL